jgi:hypothetical protein
MFYSEALTILGQGLEYRFNINVAQEKTDAQRHDVIARFISDEEFVSFIKSKVEQYSEAHTGDFA